MQYISTRGKSSSVTAAEAIVMGIAPDGGLMVPQKREKFSLDEIMALDALQYPERAASILKSFLTDWDLDFLKYACKAAYGGERFDTPVVAPVYNLTDTVSILELWHGPTCAFKDMALQMLPHLLTQGVKMTGDESEIVILVATSGDTGKAALEGFKDVPGTRIVVFYPADGVSHMQRLQMLTQEGRNVNVVAVKGNFDHAQSGVKEIFGDEDMVCKMREKGLKFSSANSINWGRLVPQIVYYVSAYIDLVANRKIKQGDEINFVVPTGNFGNILAGFYAKELGVPIKRLICASNENNVLTDFLRTGIYDRERTLHLTISPSMDILISSNLERLLFEITEHDHARVGNWMNQLREKGRYEVDKGVLKKIQELFYGDFATDSEAIESIKDVFYNYNYLIDPHTAVAMTVCKRYQRDIDPNTQTVVISTASPFKFNESVAKAILEADELKGKDEFRLLRDVSDFAGIEVPKGLRDLDKKPIVHRLTCERGQMKEVLTSVLCI